MLLPYLIINKGRTYFDLIKKKKKINFIIYLNTHAWYTTATILLVPLALEFEPCTWQVHLISIIIDLDCQFSCPRSLFSHCTLASSTYKIWLPLNSWNVENDFKTPKIYQSNDTQFIQSYYLKYLDFLNLSSIYKYMIWNILVQ